MFNDEDREFMARAIELARRAAELGEVPVGAVIAGEGRIIGEGHNLRESEKDPTAHAEIIALRMAAKSLGHWRVTPAVCYVTLEPCPMCAGALVNARVGRLVYGCPDPKAGAAGTLYNIPRDGRLNHRMEVVSGAMADECAALLKDFFRGLRQGGR